MQQDQTKKIQLSKVLAPHLWPVYINPFMDARHHLMTKILNNMKK